MFCVGVHHIYGPKVRPVFGEKVVVCVLCWCSSHVQS